MSRHYLREWLSYKDISQRQLAIQNNHLENSINRYCANPNYRIDASIALRIAEFLGITVEELYHAPPKED